MMFQSAVKFFWLMVCGHLLLCSGAMAEVKVGAFTLTPMAGYHMIDGGLGLDDSSIYGLACGYSITKRWALEGDLRFSPTETDVSNAHDVDIWTFSMNSLYHFRPQQRFTPYLLFGVGGLVYKTSGDSNTDDDYIGNVGGGFKYALNDTMSLRFDLRHVLNYRNDVKNESDWRHHLQAMAGISFQLGGTPSNPVKKTRIAEPMLKAKPVPVAESLELAKQPVDSDRDGVFDTLDKCPNTAPGVRVDASGCPADTDGDGVADFLDACIDTPRDATVDERGCPRSIQQPVATLAIHINFGFDRDTVTPFHYSELQKAADFIAQYPGYHVDVQGHTDSQGDEGYNRQLSERRAESVRAVLVNRYGVASERMTSSGAGESQPVADNDTEEGRSRNRRVEIDIFP